MKSTIAAFLTLMTFAAGARAASDAAQESILFQSAVDLYNDPSRDREAAIQAFEKYLESFPDNARAADAQFMIGESYFRQALGLIQTANAKKAAAFAPAPKADGTPGAAPAGTGPLDSEAVQKALRNARYAYRNVLVHHRNSGLGASAQYRLGELEYDQQHWKESIEEFRNVDSNDPRSYIAPDSWIGVIFSDLALEDFSSAESHLYALGESYPYYMKVPAVLYAQGLVSLHKSDYVGAEKAFSQISSPESLFYLGKTYLLSGRPFLAATTFDRLIQDYPSSELREQAEFSIGDAFYFSKDYDGAITKYQRFLDSHPDSPLKAAALYRVGSSYFQKKDFVNARASYQSVIDRYGQDYFAPLAQYAVAESYMASNQTREAMFAYSKVITQYSKAEKILPWATYKLAWTQHELGNFAQAAQTCRNFITLYPKNDLIKSVYLMLGNSEADLNELSDAVSAWQRVIDLAPNTEVAEQAMFLILRSQYQQRNFGSILTSYQFIFRHLPPSQSKWRSLAYLYAADAYLAMNRVDEAESIYEMILKVYPTDTAAVYAQDGIAWCYTYRGDDAKALDERQKLNDMLTTASSSGTAVGRNELGMADSLFNQKSYDDAYQLYQKFADSHPSSPEAATALYRSGMSLYHLRYYSQAVEAWQKLENNYPNAPELRLALPQEADTLFRTGKYPQAIAAYRKLLEKFPDGPQAAMAYLRLAHASFNSKDDGGALKGAMTLVEKFPAAPEAKDALDLMEAVFDRTPSINYYDTLSAVVRAHPRTPIASDAQFRLARRLYERKDYVRASQQFQQFSVDFTDSPQLAKAQFMLAESLFAGSKFQEAIAGFQRYLNNFPRSQDTALALFHLAGSHYNLKEYEPAAVNYQRLAEEYPDSEFVKPALFNMALSYKNVGKLENAQDAYTRYSRLVGIGDPSVLSALWEVFNIQKESKNYDGALETLRQIRASIKPGSDALLEDLYRTGEVYTLMNKSDDASQVLERLRELKPASSPFRLQGLIKLGEIYEKTDPARAMSVYEDLARNSPNQKIAKAARERATVLRDSLKSRPSSSKKPKNTAQENDNVQVMPTDAQPPTPAQGGQ